MALRVPGKRRNPLTAADLEAPRERVRELLPDFDQRAPTDKDVLKKAFADAGKTAAPVVCRASSLQRLGQYCF